VVRQFTEDMSLGRQIHLVDEVVGYRSAHLGGCGGANGEVADNHAIAENSAIMASVKTLMSVPKVKQYLGASYRDELGGLVRANAAKTAAYLERLGWDGRMFVDGVVTETPGNVEDLEVDHQDEKHHGHKERKITIIIGDKTSKNDDEFDWNLKASKEAASRLAGDDIESYTRALIAELAKHLAVAHRLAHTSAPVEILGA